MPDPGEFIFLTACDSGVQGHNAAVVGTVENPDENGFNLRSRNSDSATASVLFMLSL